MLRPKALSILVACALCGVTGAKAATLNPYVATMEQVGPDVVVTGTGEFDLTGLSLQPVIFSLTPLTVPAFGILGIGGLIFPFATDVFAFTGFSGPTSFGSGSLNFFASSSSGPAVGISGFFHELLLPLDYANQSLLATSQDIFSNTNLSDLGVTRGTYVWTWGTAADQSFTLNIIAPTPVPLGPSIISQLIGLGLFGLLGWRRKRKATAV
jgi:hypothetical protein